MSHSSTEGLEERPVAVKEIISAFYWPKRAVVLGEVQPVDRGSVYLRKLGGIRRERCKLATETKG